MSVEERLHALEEEVLRLKAQSAAGSSRYYQNAMQEARAYFQSIRMPGQSYGAEMESAAIARHAFREKHHRTGTQFNSPSRYICTEDDAADFLRAYKAFVTLYQQYLSQ